MTDLPPNDTLPVGTRLRLADEDSQWALIEVRGWHFNGHDSGGWDAIVQPVLWGEGDNSPRKVQPASLADLGYVIETPAVDETAPEWVTPS